MGKFEKVLTRYNTYLSIGETKHSKKFQEIRDSREAEKQYMPASAEVKTANADLISGNDPSGEKRTFKSNYLAPMVNAVGGKVGQDLVANPFQFEWGANTEVGVEIKEAYDTILLKTYTQDNTKRMMNLGFIYSIYSGTLISQTYTEERKEKRILPDGEIQEVALGRTVSFKVYDPLRTIIDWQAIPGRVAETSRFLIVTIGLKSTEWINENFPGHKAEITNTDSFSGSTTYISIDSYKRELEEKAGLAYNQGIMIREFYEPGGKYYVIADDGVVLAERNVSNGIADRIPFNIAPFILDPDSPYGRTLYSYLETPIQLVSTAINMIADNNALKQKMPFFVIKGVLKNSGVTLNDFNSYDFIELDPSQLTMMGNGMSRLSIEDLVGKIPMQDVSEGAMFLYQTGLEHIWFLTGLNPTSLGGIQQKQIRNESVAGMINQASLRSSSEIVANIEINFMNPTTKDFARIFELYFDDFPEFEAAGIQRESLTDVRNVRIVNGSYLPSDDLTEMQRATQLYQLSMANQTMDQVKATETYLKSIGYPDPSRFFKPPLEALSGEQIVTLLQLLQQGGMEQTVQVLSQQLQQKQTEAGV